MDRQIYCAITPEPKRHRRQTNHLIRYGVVGNISACHADAQGSIPCTGALFTFEMQDFLTKILAKKCSPTGIRTRVVWVKTTYPDQLDYWGSNLQGQPGVGTRKRTSAKLKGKPGCEICKKIMLPARIELATLGL